MKKRKRPITLLEIMIVIFLIGIIGSVVGYNIKGSLEKGKAFKTEQAIKRVREILLLELSLGHYPENDDKPASYLATHADIALKASGLISDPNALLKDGWGVKLIIEPFEDESDFTISSPKLDAYHGKDKKAPAIDNEG